MLAVLLHVDTRSVTGVTLHIDLSATHGIACGVPNGAVNHDGPGVHGVAHGVLGVAEDLNVRTVQVRTQGVAGNAVDLQLPAFHARGNEPLAQTALQDRIVLGLPEPFSKLQKVHVRSIDRKHYTTPPKVCLRYSAPKGSRDGSFFTVSKSMESRGRRSRIRAV